jgi:DNA-binding PadR family transcriptional regulator
MDRYLDSPTEMSNVNFSDVEREMLKGNTPLLVLAILRDGAAHGYAIAKEIARRTDKALAFKHGTLYPVLTSLERSGYIAVVDVEGENNRHKRVFEITSAGRKHLADRMMVWEKFSRAVAAVVVNPSY